MGDEIPVDILIHACAAQDGEPVVMWKPMPFVDASMPGEVETLRGPTIIAKVMIRFSAEAHQRMLDYGWKAEP